MTSEQHFRKLLIHAWSNSLFYRQLYSDYGIREEDLSRISLEELPTITKLELMGRFDDAVTDPRLHKADVKNWVGQDTNPLNLYLNEYIIIHSSAGSGAYSYIPYTRQAWRYMTAAVAPFLLPSTVEMNLPVRSAFFYKSEGHFAGVTNAALASRAAHEVLRFSLLDPVEEIWARLNAFQPERIYSYASSMAWLAEWTLRGKLRIKPGSVIVSGDRLTPYVRSVIRDAWNADIYDLYAACESLYIGIQVPGSSDIRIFENLNILEVVDASNHTVMPGERGRVLLTNLYNTTLPLIRYDLSDNAVLGRGGKFVETLAKLDGRSYDSLPLQLTDGKVGVLETHELEQIELPGVEKVQFISRDLSDVEILYQSRQDLDAPLRQAFQDLLTQKSAIMHSVKVQRVECLYNDQVSSKFHKVLTLSNRAVELKSLVTENDRDFLPILPPPGGEGDTFPPLEQTGSLGQRFEWVVERYPDRYAISDGTRHFSYRELDLLSRRVAAQLLVQGFDVSRPVAVLSDHQIEFAPLVLGIVRAGGFYLPLDTNLPFNRLKALLAEAHPEYLLTTLNQKEFANRLAVEQIAVLCPEENQNSSETTQLPSPALDAPACLLYTSGTTGTPKGVVLSHKTILSRVERYSNDFHIKPEDRISFLQSYSVSAGIRDIYGAFLNAAVLVLYDIRSQGLALLANWLDRNQITIFYAVPSVFRLFLETLFDEKMRSVRIVRLGGESPRPQDVTGFRRHFSAGCWLANGYASTETDTISQFFIDQESQVVFDRVPAGFPVQGANVSLQDGSQKPVVDALGEICVDGNLLASGYWDAHSRKINPLKHPFPTGDLGYQLPDKRIFLSGRKDLVAKLHGYRIHLGEIEQEVRNVRGIADAVAILQRTPAGDEMVVVYYVLAGATQVSPAELRQAVALVLPGPAIPSAFTVLPKLPRLPGGKINRDMLQFVQEIEPVLPAAAPVYQSETEERLARIWQDVLGVAEIDPTANFFELGGDSITLLRVLNRILAEFGVHLSFSDFFAYPVLAELSRKIEDCRDDRPEGFL